MKTLESKCGSSSSRDLPELQGVFVAVVGDDVDVRRAVRSLRLDADEAAGDMAAVEDPVHRVPTEDGGDLLLGGKHDQGRLQQAGADHRRRLRLGHRDGARRVRLKGCVRGDGAGEPQWQRLARDRQQRRWE